MPEELTLLPCPACQSKTEFYSEYGRHGAGCHKYGIGTRAAYSTEERAAEVWNSLPRAMVWTNDPPQVPGWYFARKKLYGEQPSVTVWYCEDPVETAHVQLYLKDKTEWAGPIPMPREPTE